MRKTILIPGLLLALCLLLGGCVKTVDAPQPDKTCAQWADAVQAAADFRELTDMTEKHLEKNLLISVNDLEDWVMRRDASRVTPEMILIVKVKAGADQAAVKQAFQSYNQELLDSNRNYQPDQVYMLENAKAVENGPFVALIVSPDAEKTSAALGSGWK